MTTDTVAVDREALAKALRDCFGPPSENEWGELSEEARNDWREDADAILASGILRDVREVEHTHGERIAKAIEPRSNGGISRGSVIRLGALNDAARLARELSPEPS